MPDTWKSVRMRWLFLAGRVKFTLVTIITLGTGSVLVNAGHLHLDSGDIDRAEGEAAKAYRLGEERQDHILMARSRILQATVQNERVEEQVGERGSVPAWSSCPKLL